MPHRYSRLASKSTNVRIDEIKQRLLRWAVGSAWRLAPGWVESVIAGQFFAPVAYRLSSDEANWLKRGQPFRLSVGRRTIQGWQWGRGPGILFVHGWNGRGVQFHPFFPPFLEAGFSVTAVDAPAHGDSQGRTTNYFEFTDTVREMLRRGGGASYRGIVAHSLGGSAVINALSKENMAVDTALIAPALRLKEILFNTFNRCGIPDAIFESMIADLERRFGYDLSRDNPHLLIENLRQGLLVIHDQEDPLIPFSDARTAARRHPEFTLISTSGLGHKQILEDPWVIETVAAHFTRQPAIGAKVASA